MPRVLLDTNILVFLASPRSVQHVSVQRAVERLIERGATPVLSPQVVYEFWSVATRPLASNGLGWRVDAARSAIVAFLRQYEVLNDPPETLDLWIEIVVTHDLKGKRIHDAHLLATMKANGVSQLLTLNAADFPAEAGIAVLTPGA